MKALVSNYTFNKTAKTVTFNNYQTIELKRVLLITNMTVGNTLIFNFADSTLTGTVSTNVLTLTYDTSAMANTDELQIWYELDDSEKPQTTDRIGFAKAIASGVDTDWGTVIATGSGQTVAQTGGKLVLTAGTTARSETIIRSNRKYGGNIRLKARSTLSQRIANNSFFVELVDVQGDALAYNITSATVMTVTFASSPFTSANVGQSAYIGNFAGTGTFLSGRYAIASVAGNVVTFTVSGFAAGTGTCSVFGWNHYHLLYDGTTATNAKFDTQRRGYNTGDTTITINTTAAPGHLATIQAGTDQSAIITDQLVASSTAVRPTVRASRDENIPDDYELYLQVRSANGATAPATSTTWTIGFLSLADYTGQDVIVQDTRQGSNTPIPVDILRSASIATTGTTTATLAAGTAVYGKGAITGQWFDTTTTNLAASATFTGTGRDLFATATATAWSAATVYAQEYRICAEADVVGDLYLEVSRDNTTFRRVKKVTATQPGGAGQPFYAEIIHRPSTRYARAVYINGAGAQTHFFVQEAVVGG